MKPSIDHIESFDDFKRFGRMTLREFDHFLADGSVEFEEKKQAINDRFFYQLAELSHPGIFEKIEKHGPYKDLLNPELRDKFMEAMIVR